MKHWIQSGKKVSISDFFKFMVRSEGNTKHTCAKVSQATELSRNFLNPSFRSWNTRWKMIVEIAWRTMKD